MLDLTILPRYSILYLNFIENMIIYIEAEILLANTTYKLLKA